MAARRPSAQLNLISDSLSRSAAKLAVATGRHDFLADTGNATIRAIGWNVEQRTGSDPQRRWAMGGAAKRQSRRTARALRSTVPEMPISRTTPQAR